MGAFIIAFIILLLAQILIAIRAFFHQKNLPYRFAYILSDLPDPATTLEKYMRIYRKIGIKVNAQINLPAIATSEFIMVKRDSMYEQDLYTNMFVLTQLELTKKMYRLLRNMVSIQNMLFFGGIILFICGVSINFEYAEFIVMLAVACQVIAIALAIVGFELYSIAFEEILFIAEDLLNLDDLEKARAEQLAEEFKFRVFEYPLDIPLKLLYFFSF